jgi:site-specific DNA recombinase
MAVAVYLRVSTEEQRERQSIATQRDFAQRYCELHQLSVFRVYSEDGISGTVALDRRPEGAQLLEDARQHKFDQILIYKLDRLGRETRLILNAVAELEKLGVRIRSMTEEFDTGSATGRLMLTMLSGFAAHEREVIRERSMAGTDRVAQAGAWMGGIVPYGYRKQGERGEARLILSDEPISEIDLSETDVIQLIYKMAAVEKKSCFKIADRLNQLRVPCAYIRDGRMQLRGKRKQKTSGMWRAGRVRNLLISRTYMGRHEYGKRSKNKARKLICRRVPAIVTEEVWQKAQDVLKSNQLFCKRNAKNKYLLRGLVKCGLCNLTYIGTFVTRPNGKEDFYYRCNGKHGTRGLYGENGQRCPSKDMNGSELEKVIWADVEAFLRDPGQVLQELHRRMAGQLTSSGRPKQKLERLHLSLQNKSAERDRVIGLFRRGRITDAQLDEQMNDIEAEEQALSQAIAELDQGAAHASQQAEYLVSAETLLNQLRTRLDEPLSWELKRQLIEVLVGNVRIDTAEHDGKKAGTAIATYRFASSVVTCTDTRACNNCTLERVHRTANRRAA